jgi:hypothetical protein
VVVVVRLDKTPAFLVLLAGLVAVEVEAVQVLLLELLPVLETLQVHHHHREILVAAEHLAVEHRIMALEEVAGQAQWVLLVLLLPVELVEQGLHHH